MSAGASFTLPSPHIRQRNGLRNSSARHFPSDSAPQYLLRNRDRIFGHQFVEQVKAMGIEQVLSAPSSPWQQAYIKRVIGTTCRECFDHVIVSDESSLYRHLQAFCSYYHRTRTHLALQKDTPEPRSVQVRCRWNHFDPRGRRPASQVRMQGCLSETSVSANNP